MRSRWPACSTVARRALRSALAGRAPAAAAPAWPRPGRRALSLPAACSSSADAPVKLAGNVARLGRWRRAHWQPHPARPGLQRRRRLHARPLLGLDFGRPVPAEVRAVVASGWASFSPGAGRRCGSYRGLDIGLPIGVPILAVERGARDARAEPGRRRCRHLGSRCGTRRASPPATSTSHALSSRSGRPSSAASASACPATPPRAACRTCTSISAHRPRCCPL